MGKAGSREQSRHSGPPTCAIDVKGWQRHPARRSCRLQQLTVLRHSRAIARAEDGKLQLRRHCCFLYTATSATVNLLFLLCLLLPLLRRQHSCHRCTLREAKHAIKGALLAQHCRQRLLRLLPSSRLLLKLPLIHDSSSGGGCCRLLAVALLLLLLLLGSKLLRSEHPGSPGRGAPLLLLL